MQVLWQIHVNNQLLQQPKRTNSLMFQLAARVLFRASYSEGELDTFFFFNYM